MRNYVEYIHYNIIKTGWICMDNIQEENWINNSATFELKYNTAKDFFKNQNSMIPEFIDTFPHYNSQNVNNIMMHTDEFPGISFSLNPNRFGLTFEAQYSRKDITKNIDSTYHIAAKNMHIDKFKRIGFRVKAIKKMDIGKAKDIVNSYINSNKIDESFSLDASNFTMILNYGDYKIRAAYNVVLAQSNIISNMPIRSINISINTNPPFQSDIHGISADIDFYKMNADNTDTSIEEFIKKAYEGIEKCRHLMD